jgi:hypothetical protein
MSSAGAIAPRSRPRDRARGSRPMEGLAWLGLLLGLVCLSSSAIAGPPAHRFAAAGLPAPAEITAYVTALCGAITMVANTAFILWHKLRDTPPHRRKGPKRAKKPPTRPDPAPSPG